MAARPIKTARAAPFPASATNRRDFTLPNGSKETVYTFGYYMRKFITETKAKGATPVVLSLTVRNIWKDAAVERGPGKYSQWSADTRESRRRAIPRCH